VDKLQGDCMIAQVMNRPDALGLSSAGAGAKLTCNQDDTIWLANGCGWISVGALQPDGQLLL
jgi:hypothetical protein